MHSTESIPRTENELIAILARRLPELLQGLKVDSILRQPPSIGDYRPDLLVKVRKGQLKKKLVIEAKLLGEPRIAERAFELLRRAKKADEGAYPVLASRYVTETTRRLCREAGIGYIDLLGNVYLEFNHVLIDRQVPGSFKQEERSARQLLAPKATRVLRALLLSRTDSTRITDLAKECSMTPAGVYFVVRLLEDKGFVQRDEQRKVVLVKRGNLLDVWAKSWDIKKNAITGYFALESDPGKIIRRIAEVAKRKKLRYALTLMAGASKVAPFVRYQDVWFYIDGSPDPWIRELELRPVSSGANVVLLQPYDEGVFMGLQDSGGAKVVSNVQLFVDLLNHPARGREQAEFLREQKLGF